MDSITRLTAEEKLQLQVQKDFGWNFAFNTAEGMFWWFGSSFFAYSTIMPLYVKHLTDNPVLIGLVAAISGAGWFLPQLLTASYTERLDRKKPMVVKLGFFTERLPLLVMSLSALALGRRSPAWALVLFFITLAWHTLGTGVIAIAWQEMIARVIPVNYRGRMLGTAGFGGTALGVLGAALSARILGRYPFPESFALCFGIGFGLLLFSWALVAQTREPPGYPTRAAVPLMSYWRSLPAVLRRDRNFAAFLLSRILGAISRVGIGFVVVYAAERWLLTDSRASLFTATMLASQALANLLFGMLADRRGHRVVLQTVQALGAAAMISILVVPTPGWMFAIFAVLGTMVAADVSGVAIVMEFAAPDELATYVGLANTITGMFAAIAPLIGGWIAGVGGYPALFVTAGMLYLLAWSALTFLVREPRHQARGR